MFPRLARRDDFVDFVEYVDLCREVSRDEVKSALITAEDLSYAVGGLV